MIFGIVYDAESVRIVAHVPYEIPDEDGQAKCQYPRYSYMSCVIDTISYRGGRRCDKTSALDRFRVAMAMVCLGIHAEFLAALLDPSTSWPEDVVDAAESVRLLYQPTLPTTSDEDASDYEDTPDDNTFDDEDTDEDEEEVAGECR
ncbi:hypothetical protein EWM64_g1378 [Hericium alpestre]|uniref:Uncharacterized protein n=1 Tax=Hericium alpestre TaxID=135208 RepID=A0A4Z0AAR8_9AGAM|nr:hypothetical protein EWM64_g1378 [Hericium alpestre]